MVLEFEQRLPTSRFRILGPIEAWTEEGCMKLGGPTQLRLFAFLMLHANRAVSNDTLTAAVWSPAGTTRDNRLQMAIARLRKALAPFSARGDVMLTCVGGGYLLSMKPDQLDAELFCERLRLGVEALEAQNPALAARVLAHALALWRGPALLEVAGQPFAQHEIRRLEGRRQVAIEMRIEADLQLGRHEELIGELTKLLAEMPTRERIASQLMLALDRVGRHADALGVYRDVESRLAEQLGVPGPVLKARHAEILRPRQFADVGTIFAAGPYERSTVACAPAPRRPAHPVITREPSSLTHVLGR